jgi:hypothetical protein
LTFQLARRLFDVSVAWISAIIMAGSELFWRFSVSGLSAMLSLVIFLGLVWCLVAMEQAARLLRGEALPRLRVGQPARAQPLKLDLDWGRSHDDAVEITGVT